MTNDLKISVIIPVRDHTGFLKKLLDSIRQNAPKEIGYEIIVVDDGSREDIAPLVEEYDVRYHREDASKGPAHARNIGAGMASAPLLFFLDADLEYPPGLMEHALNLLEQEPELAAISFIDQPFCKTDGIIKNYGSLIEYHFYQILVEHKPVARIFAFTTRNGIVRSEAFQEIGGFNEKYTTNAMEDYDFGKRLAGKFPVAMSNGPLIYHNFPSKLSGLLRNYWVRAKLFVPFYLDKRPTLDKAMTSRNEALLRLLGSGGLFLLLVGILLFGLFGKLAFLLSSLGAVMLMIYIVCLKDFIILVLTQSGSYLFLLNCLGIHLLSSVVIVAGAFYGLLEWFTSASEKQEHT